MILDAKDLGETVLAPADVVVIGAGPAGIVVALEMARSGSDVLLIESGRPSYSERIQQLSDAAQYDHDLHAPLSIALRRQVGGTSTIWGGRCVPYDPIDFDSRDYMESTEWPIAYEDLLPFYERACLWTSVGRPVFDTAQAPQLSRPIVPGFIDGDVRNTTLERWSLPTNFGREYRDLLRGSKKIRLVTGLTCTEIVCAPGEARVDHLECRSLDGTVAQVRGRRYVLAAGGLEGTRLLLASTGPNGGALGNHSDHLGRWYMSHIEGVISNVHFTTPPRQTLFGIERDVDGVYVRRRLSFSREFQHERRLPNIVAWLANREPADPKHQSGVLSFVYLMLSSPLGKFVATDAQRRSLRGEKVPGSPYGEAEQGPVVAHLKNIIRQPIATVRFIFSFGIGRFLSRRSTPGFFIYSPRNVYPLQYHGEHRPHRDSRVTLADDRDELGVPKLRIDIRFSDEDVNGVIAAHECWDEYLRRTGCGEIEYLHDDLGEAILSRAGGGFHQIGTTRMATNPDDGVVDANLTVHGVDNLSVVSSSTFVTSGQANSTLLIVMLAIRLAEHLKSL
ncbi:MAG: GMC family oxidoreductase [Acidimicrobiales bacterium]